MGMSEIADFGGFKRVPKPHLLRRAPIREAVIDIQIPVGETPDFEALEELARSTEGYPTVQQGFQVASQFELAFDPEADDGPPLPKPRRSGFRAISEDELQIAQFRWNGFAFSRLAPYESWDKLSDAAKMVWQRYRARIAPKYATRVSLRYVNHIRLSYPLDPGDYFTAMPRYPEEWPQNVSSFVFRQTVHDQPSGLSANVMHALVDDVDEDKIGVIFDIEAYAEGPISLRDEALWGTLDHLRDLKNRVFFAGLTQKAVSLFE
jgi:uncharacterized protein (TIGR04255 family)